MEEVVHLLGAAARRLDEVAVGIEDQPQTDLAAQYGGMFQHGPRHMLRTLLLNVRVIGRDELIAAKIAKQTGFVGVQVRKLGELMTADLGYSPARTTLVLDGRGVVRRARIA